MELEAHNPIRLYLKPGITIDWVQRCYGYGKGECFSRFFRGSLESVEWKERCLPVITANKVRQFLPEESSWTGDGCERRSFDFSTVMRHGFSFGISYSPESESVRFFISLTVDALVRQEKDAADKHPFLKESAPSGTWLDFRTNMLRRAA